MAGQNSPQFIFTVPSISLFGNPQKGVRGTLRWNPAFAARRATLFMRGQQRLDGEVQRALEPYMPRDTGRMIEGMQLASKAGNGKIVVDTPYAAAVHYGRAVTGKNGALRGPYYFERMKISRGQALRQMAAEEMGASK